MPGGNKKVTDAFKYVWPFCYQQALKGSETYSVTLRCCSKKFVAKSFYCFLVFIIELHVY